LLLLFGAALAWVYGPALRGPFLSDDLHHVSANPYVTRPGSVRVADLLDPRGEPTWVVQNYAPLPTLVHATAWRIFGASSVGHHALGLALHALVSVLLAALLARSGLPAPAAVLGAAFFLLHPANVEVAAWISQLKTLLAMLLTLAALLWLPGRPALASVCFALGLLSKASAAVALPVAALFAWTRGAEPRWRWLCLWGIAVLAYVAIELPVARLTNAGVPPLHADVLVWARSVVALAGRYLAMAVAGFGLSTFHSPSPASSPLDPWWLGSLLALAALGVRAAFALRRRSEEVAYWAWSALSFAPISQIVPTLFPLADRYLYFILPGLIGATLLAGRDALVRWLAPPQRRLAAAFAAALAAVWVGLLGVRANQRAGVWSSEVRMQRDARAHYPDGLVAMLFRVDRAAARSDPAAGTLALRAAHARGYHRFEGFAWDPRYAALRADPEFRAIVADMAGAWTEVYRDYDGASQVVWRGIGRAHMAREEWAAAEAAFGRALEIGGLESDATRRDLLRLRALRASADTAGERR
jgi:hypothetical protein